MKCFTADIRHNGFKVESGVTIPYYADNDGLWASLGSPRLALARAMLTDENAYDRRDSELVVWRCGLLSGAKRCRIVPCSETGVDLSALVLVTADSDMTTEECECVISRSYEKVAHPVSGAAVYEWRTRLVKLEPGESIVVTVTSKSAHLLGVPLSRGVQVDVRVHYDGDSLKLTFENRRPSPAKCSMYELGQESIMLFACAVFLAALCCIDALFSAISGRPITVSLMLFCVTTGFFGYFLCRAVSILLHWRKSAKRYTRDSRWC